MAAPPHQLQKLPAYTWLKSFCPTIMETVLHDVISQKHPGTNRWFLEDNKIVSWLKDDSATAAWIVPGQDTPTYGIRKLWLYGPYGCGKTVLSGSIIEHLMQRRTPQQVVCYYFCSRLKLDTILPVNILKTLVSQLAQQNETATEILRGCVEDGTVPNGLEVDGATKFDCQDLTHLAKLFELISGLFGRVSIVINSIDQLNVDKEEQLVRLFTPIIDKPTSSVRGLFTTADTPDQQRLCMESHSCPIFVKGRPEDIRLFVKSAVQRRIGQGAMYLESIVVQLALEEHIVGQSNGAWLWAVCELEYQFNLVQRGVWHLKHSPTASETAMPYGMYGPDKNDWRVAMFPYGSHLERILKEGIPRNDFILSRVLRWTYASTEMSDAQLTMSEIRDALSLLLAHNKVTVSQSEPDVQENEILEICGPLIRKSTEKDGLEFGHYTVEGYLGRFVVENNPDLQKFQVTPNTCGEAVDDLVLLCTLLEARKWAVKAEAMHRKVLRIRERFWGSDHRLTLASMNNLAMFYCDQSRDNEAETLYARALQAYEKAKEPDQASMLNTINNIAVMRKNQGRYDEAEAMYKRVIQGREELLGLEHDATLGAMNNLALLYVQRGKRQEATAMWELTLPVHERIAGPGDIKTLNNIYNLGIIWKNRGGNYRAGPYLERALEGYEQLFGPEHTLVLDAMDNLGQVCLQRDSQIEYAEELFETLLKIREKALGPDHPLVISVVENLGRAYGYQETTSNAEAMIERVIENRTRTLGLEHMSTLDTYVTMGDIFRYRGQIEDAVGWYDQALQGYKKTLGPGHEKTINRIDESIALYNNLVEMKERSFGPEHTTTLDALNKSASLHELYGKDDEAISIWERVRNGYEKSLGPEHMSTFHVIHQIGKTYKKQLRMDEAEKTLLEVLEAFERSTGSTYDCLAVGRDLVEMYNRQGRHADAEDVRRRVSVVTRVPRESMGY
ncbi:Nephrocystin-3-like protein [Cladobotryum mycophilum]|uniref:Nephrocystin-3-like protein n=1 Tax=Cladobotryum mycophilum TaxID=491253 RepID=A0ABR0SA44_9HYPO